MLRHRLTLDQALIAVLSAVVSLLSVRPSWPRLMELELSTFVRLNYATTTDDYTTYTTPTR